MSEIEIFDRRAIRHHRTRATLTPVADLLATLADRLLDRLDDTTHRFSHALDIGGRGSIAPALRARDMHVTSLDQAAALAARAGGAPLAADPDLLPFAPNSFDLIVASLSLHWTNDLPGALIQLRQCLRPDGLFLASLPILPTLDAFRTALTETESLYTGGASPRVSPFPDLRDCAALLQRAGFALPVADAEDIDLLYDNRLALLHDLRAAGETNALRLRARRPPPRALLPAALAAMPAKQGRMHVHVRLAFLTGWSPAPSQPKPLTPGSARISLIDALGDRPA